MSLILRYTVSKLNRKVSNSWIVTVVSIIVTLSAPFLDGPLAEHGIIISESDLEHLLYSMIAISGIGAGVGIHKRSKKNENEVAESPTTTKEPATTIKESYHTYQRSGRQTGKSDRVGIESNIGPAGPTEYEMILQREQQRRDAQLKSFAEAQPQSDTVVPKAKYIPETTGTAKLPTPKPTQTPVDLTPTPYKVPENLMKVGNIVTNLQTDDKLGPVLPYGTPFLWYGFETVKTTVSVALFDENRNVIQVEHTNHAINPGPICRFELFIRKGGEYYPLPRGKYFIEIKGDKGTSSEYGHRPEDFLIV